MKRVNSMNLIINGKKKAIAEVKTVAQFVSSVFANSPDIIIELNKKIIKKKDWEGQSIKENDVIEVIQIVGGG